MATTLASQVSQAPLVADYDRSSDVLYITLGPIRPVEGDGLPGGVELDYTLEDGTACGVTVIGFQRNGWQGREGELARIVGAHLGRDASRIEEVVGEAFASAKP